MILPFIAALLGTATAGLLGLRFRAFLRDMRAENP